MSDFLEQLTFKNKATATLNDAQTGETIKTITMPNIVTNVGEQLILDSFGNVSGAYLKYCAVGHSGGIASAGSILLVSELDRAEFTYTRAGQIATFSSFFNTAAANSGTITEIAFFGGTSANTSRNTGIMFNRILISSAVTLITKTADYTLTVDLDVTF